MCIDGAVYDEFTARHDCGVVGGVDMSAGSDIALCPGKNSREYCLRSWVPDDVWAWMVS